jgi:hypothetical protein
MSDTVWSPLVAGLLCLVVGMLGLVAGQPWLFPALGPTAFQQAYQVTSRSSSFYNTVVGHTIAIVIGYGMVELFALSPTSALFRTYELTAGRVWASTLAVTITLLVQLILKAFHPPAAATALLITLGAFSARWTDVLALFAGVLIVATLGEGLRLVRERGRPSRPAGDL